MCCIQIQVGGTILQVIMTSGMKEKAAEKVIMTTEIGEEEAVNMKEIWGEKIVGTPHILLAMSVRVRGDSLEAEEKSAVFTCGTFHMLLNGKIWRISWRRVMLLLLLVYLK